MTHCSLCGHLGHIRTNKYYHPFSMSGGAVKKSKSKSKSKPKSKSKSKKKSSKVGSKRFSKKRASKRGSKAKANRPKMPVKNAAGNHIVYVAPAMFYLIKAGLKTVEPRLNFGRFAEMKVGESVKFITKMDGKEDSMVKKIAKIEKYGNFVELLKAKGTRDVFPGLPSRQCSLQVLKKYYRIEHEKQSGVIAITIA